MESETFGPGIPENSLPLMDELGFQKEKLDKLQQHLGELTGNKEFQLPLPSSAHIERNAHLIIALSEAIVDLQQEKEPINKSTTKPDARTYLSRDEIAQQSSAISLVLGVSGMFGDNIKDKVGRFVERKATEKLRRRGKRVLEMIDLMEQTPNPKTQLIDELSQFHQQAVTHKEGEGIFVKHIGFAASDIVIAKPTTASKRFINSYPLCSGLIRFVNFPLNRYIEKIDRSDLIAPEIVRGVGRFVRSQGRQALDLPNHFSLRRVATKTFVGSKLQQVENNLPLVLQDVVDLIPSDGKVFATELKKQFASIAEMKKQGIEPKEIITRIGLLPKKQ